MPSERNDAMVRLAMCIGGSDGQRFGPVSGIVRESFDNGHKGPPFT